MLNTLWGYLARSNISNISNITVPDPLHNNLIFTQHRSMFSVNSPASRITLVH